MLELVVDFIFFTVLEPIGAGIRWLFFRLIRRPCSIKELLGGEDNTAVSVLNILLALLFLLFLILSIAYFREYISNR